METKIDEIIEKWGVYYKRTGHQPMMGRLMAYLMVVDPPHQTFEEIVSSLRSSKSSVSNTLTLMTQLGMVDYVRFPGDRKRRNRCKRRKRRTLPSPKKAQRKSDSRLLPAKTKGQRKPRQRVRCRLAGKRIRAAENRWKNGFIVTCPAG